MYFDVSNIYSNYYTFNYLLSDFFICYVVQIKEKNILTWNN